MCWCSRSFPSVALVDESSFSSPSVDLQAEGVGGEEFEGPRGMGRALGGSVAQGLALGDHLKVGRRAPGDFFAHRRRDVEGAG